MYNNENYFYGTGRRKSSVARVRLLPGSGNVTINGRAMEDYFGLETLRMLVRQPLELTGTMGKFDVMVNVVGGGVSGHGHGGIFRIPILDKGLLSTDRTLVPDYDGGLYSLGGEQFCFVSRGLGSNTVPIRAFRLFNRPDLPVIILHTK